jgi:hypothetical protein
MLPIEGSLKAVTIEFPDEPPAAPAPEILPPPEDDPLAMLPVEPKDTLDGVLSGKDWVLGVEEDVSVDPPVSKLLLVTFPAALAGVILCPPKLEPPPVEELNDVLFDEVDPPEKSDDPTLLVPPAPGDNEEPTPLVIDEDPPVLAPTVASGLNETSGDPPPIPEGAAGVPEAPPLVAVPVPGAAPLVPDNAPLMPPEMPPLTAP